MKPRLLAFLLLGPITGPCAALSLWGFRSGRPVIGVLGLALAFEFWFVAPALLAWIVRVG